MRRRHNMIGKSNAGLLDESSATVLHQIIEALKLVKISKADRHELSLEQSIYQEWNLRKIFSGWRKFLLKMWKSATPMEDRNNPRSLVVPDGMKPSVYLAAAKKYFSACIIKHIFHNVEITYKYPNRHDHKAVIIQYSIKRRFLLDQLLGYSHSYAHFCLIRYFAYFELHHPNSIQ